MCIFQGLPSSLASVLLPRLLSTEQKFGFGKERWWVFFTGCVVCVIYKACVLLKVMTMSCFFLKWLIESVSSCFWICDLLQGGLDRCIRHGLVFTTLRWVSSPAIVTMTTISLGLVAGHVWLMWDSICGFSTLIWSISKLRPAPC